ncbi:MAG: hypothetical protein ACRDRI_17615 [Pseudonocardiaceae bacterium]
MGRIVFENGLFSRPDEAARWQPRVQLPILDAPSYVAAAEAESSLDTLPTMGMLRSNRPLQPTEQAVADHAAAQLRGALYRLTDAADGPLHSAVSGDISLTPGAAETVPEKALLTIHDWCRSVHTEGLVAAGEPDIEHPDFPSEPGGFSRRIAAICRGEDEELASAMTLIHFASLVHDVDPARARKLTAEWLSK